MRKVFVLMLTAIFSGCGINNIENASSPLASEDFKAYVTRHMHGKLDNPSKLDGDAIKTLKSYLSTYCTYKGGNVEELDIGRGIGYALDREIFTRNLGDSHNISICHTNSNEFIAGFAYSYDVVYRVIDGTRVITKQDWDAAMADDIREKENGMRHKQEETQKEQEHQAFISNLRTGMLVNFYKADIGVIAGTGTIQRIDRVRNTVTIYATTVFNRDNSNALIPDVAIGTLQPPEGTGLITQLPINLK